ncbi:MAG: dTDP-4-dehydrorhamnose reductase [Candidatus Beckwithbacteria bacterium GW2011_GWB1_47_15]|uniref:dTDP-4-dehydrorhamnose reductase n=1 Tax=Candidatus Beckwithbacteria bacterium GW2011_GWB1_47_15 TaxID=1618371 RepID=A0A0G1RV83_9BACT|nr:MAG: dTDP-4-dehydrorhamnose reductase [Candidatus Beckwithbacteria bacterium GW2011_GWC1_49_16]KKU35762.1 MAG: dTDP-4-dehydrorhamnose reductase [Candidatus Beckwithbacteria bacterium GW2011_GWA1_46_30]KKU61016.1 MAG: dTDP-4-dehydrorhamnose reductase [Candidatus Beckwithbacteria bacterium GW2011_GWB1_47_15]KKU72321.1 MAG: dTDP-4-dehydrorhamnose reductase [Candidatus Beckwithbacteria bacterium GW2011_GWA2_47_25]KKW04919.1 MAG: dTDP-4-dehydrorhamnose reductase [Candidatus Beckwithbacteria bacte
MAAKSLILGTGLSGLVGSRVVELLSSQYDFVNLDLATGIDITDKSQVDRVISAHPEAHGLIHLAAFTDVSKASQQKGDREGLVYQVNVVGSQNIARVAAERKLYLIHVSTDFVFDGKNPPPGGYTEEDSTHPIEWYGQTKLMAEEAVRKSGAPAAIVRIAFPFRSHFASKLDLVRSIIDKLKTDSLHPMFADQTIIPTFIDDIATALKVFLDKKPSGTYHLVGSSGLSPFDLAQKIKTTFNLPGTIKQGSFKDYAKTDTRPRQQYLKLSNAKLKRDLGVTMSTIDQALSTLKQQLSSSTKII